MSALSSRNLITGGAGFLGSHLVDRLMEAGEEVICLDNYFTGRKSNIAHWLGHPRFELIRHDVTEPLRIEVDRIWHLACPASPVHYQFNPIKTAKTSFLGTYNMLGLARRLVQDCSLRALVRCMEIQRCIHSLRVTEAALTLLGCVAATTRASVLQKPFVSTISAYTERRFV